MNSTQRIRALVDNKPADRPGVSGWMHFPLMDGNITDFVRTTVNFTEQNSYDFVKVMYNGLYSTQDFGQTVAYSTDEKVPAGTIVKHAIEHPVDYTKLKVCDVNKGIYGREIESTKRILEYYKGEKPVIATIFSPAATAQEMYCSHKRQEMMIAAFENSPNEVKQGLEVITETTIKFLDELIKAGIDGVFFASHYCLSNVIPTDMHQEFVKKYDLEVLNSIKDHTWFNMLHLHGHTHIMLDEHLDYPVQALNWEDSEGDERYRLSIKDGMSKTDKLFIGGLNQYTDFYDDNNDRENVKAKIRARLDNVRAQIGSDRFIFAPGCAFMNDVPLYRYMIMKEVIDDYVAGK